MHFTFFGFLFIQIWKREVSLQIDRVYGIKIGLLFIPLLFLFLHQFFFLISCCTCSLVTLFLRWFVLFKIGSSIFLQQESVLLISINWLFFVSIVIIKFVKLNVGFYLAIKDLDFIVIHIFDKLFGFVLFYLRLSDFI